MSHGVYLIQQGLAELGYDPGPLDGLHGPRMASALSDAQAARFAPKAAPSPAPAPKTGLRRIVMHWTAGGPTASTEDRSHYHFIVQQDGAVVKGDRTPEDNINTADGRYAAHTLNCNTGAIGVSLCGMVAAQERPFAKGPYPIKQTQVAVMCSLVAKLCRDYGIPVTRETVLSHAEVQPTLGIVQRNKWDIAWLPDMIMASDPVTVGDKLRADISAALNLMQGA
jgi:hypothetical protein